MTGKKLIFVMIVVAVLAGGWLSALKSVSGVDQKKKQEELLSEADRFLEDSLFVRGIPLLEQAVLIETDRTAEIQEKLLEAYYQYGNMSAYETLLAQMEKTGNGKAENYLKLALYQEQIGNIEEMLQTIRRGLKYPENQELFQLYEKRRYGSRISVTAYQKILPTEHMDILPAYDGEIWSYTSIGSSYVTDGSGYEEATPFNSSGYAVVKKDGQYRVILTGGDIFSIDKVGVDKVSAVTDHFIIASKDGKYSYYDWDFNPVSETLIFDEITRNSCGLAAVKKENKWAIISDDGKLVTDYIYDNVAMNALGSVFANNRAMVKKNNEWILIDSNGNALTEKTFADARAPESDGYIAVANPEGKWGYIDESGNLILDYQYEDAKSFSCDVGAVRSLGKWGYISGEGRVVIEFDYESAEPFYDGASVVETDGSAAFIQMNYYGLTH